MAITAGLTINCSNGSCAAGIAAIYLANIQDLDQTIGVYNGFSGVSPGVFNLVTLLAGKKFYKITPLKFSAEFREDLATSENQCSSVITQELEFAVPCNDVTLRNFLEELQGQNCCGVAAIIEFNSGTPKAMGYYKNLNAYMQTSSATSGKALADVKQTIVTLQCLTTIYAHDYTGSLTTILV